MINFSKIPFVRLLIPFISGILICNYFEINWNAIYFLSLTFLALVIAHLINLKKKSTIKSYSFVFVSDVFLLLAAVYASFIINPTNSGNYFGNTITSDEFNWVGEVTELAVEKENFYKTVVEVKALKLNEKIVESSGKVLVYFKKPCDRSGFLPGQELTISSKFIVVNAQSNPEEFNYKRFLHLKGINFQTFVNANKFEANENKINWSIVYFGISIKNWIIQQLNNGALSKDAAQLCTALLTGYDDEIDKDKINAFAHSGTLHVLSVSGLHTGLVFSLLVFVLTFFDKHQKHKWLHVTVIILGLWLFVLITGFSPPVLRAAIMLSFIVIGKYLYYYFENVSINILAVSAFVLLLFNPWLLFDVGFLLSYTAVFGIIVLAPLIEKQIQVSNKFIKRVWQLTCVSVAAQISTIPITLLFFHQFPIWFIVSNLIIIPLCTLLMLLGFLLLLKASFLSSIINYVVALTYYLVGLTDNSSYGYIDTIDFRFSDTLFLTAVIIFVLLVFREKNFKYALGLLFTIITWQMLSLSEVYESKTKSSITVYQINKAYAISLKNKTKCDFKSNADDYKYQYHIRNYVTQFNYSAQTKHEFNYIETNNIKLLQVVNKEQLVLAQALKPTCLIISNNIKLNEEDLRLYQPKQIVVDGSNNYKTILNTKDLGNKLEIPVYCTKENGFFELIL